MYGYGSVVEASCKRVLIQKHIFLLAKVSVGELCSPNPHINNCAHVP